MNPLLVLPVLVILWSLAVVFAAFALALVARALVWAFTGE